MVDALYSPKYSPPTNNTFNLDSCNCGQKEDDSFIKTAKNKKERLNITDISQVDIKVPKTFNFDSILKAEKMCRDMIEEYENIGCLKGNSNLNMNINNTQTKVIQKFIEYYNDNKNYISLFSIFDNEFDKNKNSLHTICKQFFILNVNFLFTFLLL